MDGCSELGNVNLNIFEKTLGAGKSGTSLADLIGEAGRRIWIISPSQESEGRSVYREIKERMGNFYRETYFGRRSLF